MGWHRAVFVLAAAALLAACRFDGSGLDGTDGGTPPADGSAVDAAAPGGDASPGSGDARCSAKSVDLCNQAPADSMLTIAGEVVLDTDTDPRCRPYELPDGGEACLVYASGIAVSAGGSLRAIGSRPLLLAAATTLTIDGLVDVSSRRGGASGAGANPPGCPVAAAGQADIGGAGGGAGGSFVGPGGAGGNGDEDESLGADGVGAGGAAGTPGVVSSALRGGCAGGDGGDEGPGGGAGGAGGAGGGAILLYARDEVAVGAGGIVRATGAGGEAGAVQAGGGGGGAGGLIAIEAGQIQLDGVLAANGGGGGGGGARIGSTPTPGQPGADGAVGTAPAMGGTGAVAGDGGAGSSLASSAGGGGSGAVTGGGGGGGGAGAIVTLGPSTGSATISPAVTVIAP